MFTIAASERGFIRKLRRLHRLLIFLMVVVILIVALGTGVTLVRVSGSSMSPSLASGQVLILLKQKIWKSKIQKGDVVLFTTSEKNIQLIKRVEGVPGDVVTIDSQMITLKSDQYFVIGDNHDMSVDSRDFGPVTRSQIVGVVLSPHTANVTFP